MNDATQQKIEECISILEDVETELTDEVNEQGDSPPMDFNEPSVRDSAAKRVMDHCFPRTAGA